MAVADALRPGDNPVSLYGHAAQLSTQAEQLLDDAGGHRRSFRHHTIAPLIESAVELCDKGLSQPTPAELGSREPSPPDCEHERHLEDTSAIKRTTNAINTAAPLTQQSTQHGPMIWARVAALRTTATAQTATAQTATATAQTATSLAPSPTEIS